MVPLELTVHCWLVWPLQDQMMTLVPLVVPLPLASRHSVVPPAVTVSSPVEVWVQDLVAAAVAAVDLQLGAGGGAGVRHVQALARRRPRAAHRRSAAAVVPPETPELLMTCWAAAGQLPPLTWTLPVSTLLCGEPVATWVAPELYQLVVKVLSLVLLLRVGVGERPHAGVLDDVVRQRHVARALVQVQADGVLVVVDVVVVDDARPGWPTGCRCCRRRGRPSWCRAPGCS